MCDRVRLSSVALEQIRARREACVPRFIFSSSLLQKWEVGTFVPLSSLYRLPSIMTSSESLHSSRTVLAESGEGRDPEALGKVEDVPANGHNNSEKTPSSWEVTLDKSEDPKTVAAWCKWAILITVSAGAMCVTSASSMVRVAQRVRPRSDLTHSPP